MIIPFNNLGQIYSDDIFGKFLHEFMAISVLLQLKIIVMLLAKSNGRSGILKHGNRAVIVIRELEKKRPLLPCSIISTSQSLNNTY